jgi:hypothetical protein
MFEYLYNNFYLYIITIGLITLFLQRREFESKSLVTTGWVIGVVFLTKEIVSRNLTPDLLKETFSELST